MNKLPDKPSELIRLAIKDMKIVYARDDVEVNMRRWHKPKQGVCLMCAAGTVMSNSLETDPSIVANPLYYDEDIPDKLEAINNLRLGEVEWALQDLDLKPTEKFDRDINQPETKDDLPAFYIELEKLASDLEAEGL